MGGFQLLYDLSDLERLRAALVGFDADPAYRAIGEYFRTKILLGFKEGVSPKGEAWPESDRAAREGGQTLVDMAALKGSVTYEIIGNALAIGPGDFAYAAIHQFGGQAGRNLSVTIPQRQYIPGPEDITGEDMDVIGEDVYLALRSQAGRA